MDHFSHNPPAQFPEATMEIRESVDERGSKKIEHRGLISWRGISFFKARSVVRMLVRHKMSGDLEIWSDE